jgi:hypothetical protein
MYVEKKLKELKNILLSKIRQAHMDKYYTYSFICGS